MIHSVDKAPFQKEASVFKHESPVLKMLALYQPGLDVTINCDICPFV